MYIYRIYWTRDIENNRLNFPGLNYIGQTDRYPTDRYNEHLNKAFRNPSQELDKLIRQYASDIEEARKIFRFELLQIINFQGDYFEINGIIDSAERKGAMKKALIETQMLTDKAEEYWIGLYHTQYKEFGKNIQKGGKLGSKGFIIFPYIDIQIFYL